MVIKKCKICGKEFDARGTAAKCCSPECSKKNQRNEAKKWRKNNPNYHKKYYESHRDEWHEYDRNWYEKNRDEKREYDRRRYKNNRDEILAKEYDKQKKIISELCEQYHGDLESILENIPNIWQIREAKMQVWFNESYADGMIAKIKSTPACEVTGEKTDDLVIHHLYSFNTHPELGNDPANMVRIKTEIHNDFHNIYGRGNNTPEQWEEFVENF